jgi:hypothetical protein
MVCWGWGLCVGCMSGVGVWGVGVWRVKFYLTDDSQAGRPDQLDRWGRGVTLCMCVLWAGGVGGVFVGVWWQQGVGVCTTDDSQAGRTDQLDK